MSSSKETHDNPYDIDGTNFNSELFLERLLKLGSLRQVMDKEAEIVTQSQYLQSEMQTLVYENYNKFISATDTVKKMRSDFQSMQTEMDSLTENMDKIMTFSNEISNNLKESGSNVSKLCATRRLLDRLQFLFLLPSQLNEAIEQGRYASAVHDYVHAQRVLQRYGSQPSFQGIQSECEDIIARLRGTLKARLIASETSASDLAESASLLVQLGGWDGSLDEAFLTCAETRLQQHLQLLTSSLESSDVLEWVEKSNTTLLTDLAVIVSSYKEVFDKDDDESNALTIFANKILDKYFELASKILKCPANSGTEILARGLDKFFRQLQAMKDSIPSESLVRRAAEIVEETILYKGNLQHEAIKVQFHESLIKVRQNLASGGTEKHVLKDNLNFLQVQLIEKVQASLLDLMVFLQKDLSFGLKTWCVKVVSDASWNVIHQSINNVANVVKTFSMQPSSTNMSSELLLIMAKLCLELQDNGVTTLHTHMLKLLEEAAPGVNNYSRDASVITVELATAAQSALDAEVAYVGQSAAQMLRVSVMARDWLRAPEPRGPRAVCRRVVEALASADTSAAQLFPAGAKQSSDSSRRTLWSRPSSSFSPINRIFSERIEIFGPAGADRAALSAGALKVALKALVECVRLRTFGRHGLQQLQVDVHFLQQRLSCLGNDERLLSDLLQDALASAQLRCVDPQLMEPSIVDVICDRG